MNFANQPEPQEMALRIIQLEQVLRDCRQAAEENLYEPGNEHDTLESISSYVSNVLQDDYEFVSEIFE